MLAGKVIGSPILTVMAPFSVARGRAVSFSLLRKIRYSFRIDPSSAFKIRRVAPFGLVAGTMVTRPFWLALAVIALVVSET